MTQAKAEQYVTALKDTGFAEVERVSEKINDGYISIGTVLAKDGVFVSIAFSDDSFGMYIKNEP